MPRAGVSSNSAAGEVTGGVAAVVSRATPSDMAADGRPASPTASRTPSSEACKAGAGRNRLSVGGTAAAVANPCGSRSEPLPPPRSVARPPPLPTRVNAVGAKTGGDDSWVTRASAEDRASPRLERSLRALKPLLDSTGARLAESLPRTPRSAAPVLRPASAPSSSAAASRISAIAADSADDAGGGGGEVGGGGDRPARSGSGEGGDMARRG